MSGKVCVVALIRRVSQEEAPHRVRGSTYLKVMP